MVFVTKNWPIGGGKREKTGNFIWRVGLAKGEETGGELVEIFPVKAIEWKGWLKPHRYEQ